MSEHDDGQWVTDGKSEDGVELGGLRGDDSRAERGVTTEVKQGAGDKEDTSFGRAAGG